MKEAFYPTVSFAFSVVKGKTILHQLWVDQWGRSEWRPVPLMQIDDAGKLTRAPSIAGFVPEEDEGESE
jgi:hypothetical protein